LHGKFETSSNLCSDTRTPFRAMNCILVWSSSWHQRIYVVGTPWTVQLIEVSSLQNREYFYRHHRDNDNAWSLSCTNLNLYTCNLLLLISGNVQKHQSVKQSRVMHAPTHLYIRQKERPNSRFERLQLPSQGPLVSIHWTAVILHMMAKKVSLACWGHSKSRIASNSYLRLTVTAIIQGVSRL